MANTTRAKVLIIAPELSTASPAAFDLIISDVISMIGAGPYGALQERAQRYLAAHLITVTQSGGSAKEIIEEEVGDERIKYASPSRGSERRYASTAYGKEFLAIQKSCIGGMLTVTPNG